jgi:hypothetical protein
VDPKTADELAAGAPGTVTLGGKLWLISPPSDEVMLTLRQWVAQRMETPVEAIAKKVRNLPPELQEAAIREAVRSEAAGSDVTAERINRELATVEGASFWFWLLAREHQPDVDLEKDVRPLVTEANVFGVLIDLHRASSLARVAKNLPSGGGSAGPTSPAGPGSTRPA